MQFTDCYKFLSIAAGPPWLQFGPPPPPEIVLKNNISCVTAQPNKSHNNNKLLQLEDCGASDEYAEIVYFKRM